MNQYKVISNNKINDGIFDLRVEFEGSFEPGQFAMVKIPGFTLRRPLSISSSKDRELSIIYEVRGDGTKELSKVRNDDYIDIILPLGNSFPIKTGNSVIIGGGIGVPPLLGLAKTLTSKTNSVEILLGFQNLKKSFLIKDFEELGSTKISTIDGSLGEKGIVSQFFTKGFDNVFVCGPNPLLKAVKDFDFGTDDVYLSTEQRMACGIGACYGCTIKNTKASNFRVCKDGPIFQKDEIEL